MEKQYLPNLEQAKATIEEAFFKDLALIMREEEEINATCISTTENLRGIDCAEVTKKETGKQNTYHTAAFDIIKSCSGLSGRIFLDHDSTQFFKAGQIYRFACHIKPE